MLQRHEILSEFDDMVKDRNMDYLKNGAFGDVINAAQVS